MARRGGQFTTRAGLLAACAFCCLAAAPQAAGVQEFQALVDAASVSTGESIIYTLSLQSDEDLDKLAPVPPDFAGLKLVGQPATSMESRFTIINGQPQQSVRKTITYELLAEAEGSFVIAPAELTVGGQTYRTQPINITVAKASNDALPPSLKGEPILNAQSRDRNINRQIQGRMFVRPVIAKRNPWVGEPVVISYYFYWERNLGSPPIPGLEAIPQIQGAQVETIFQHQNQTQPQFTADTIDGRAFTRALLHQIAVTPAAAAPLSIEGCSVKFPIRVNSGDFLGPSSVWISAAGGRIDLQVRPLPPVPSGMKFSGTVGALKLTSSLDRPTATQGDILTLKLILEGKGNISQAYPPAFPATAEFSVFDQTQTVIKGAPAGNGMPQGKKVIEYLLRPGKAGALTIPAFSYTTFNPETEKYETLATQPQSVQVTPMAQAAVAAGSSPAPQAASTLPREINPGLRYAKPVLDLYAPAPSPLPEGVLYWLVQAVFGAGAAGMFFVQRKRERIDPALLRRSRAAAEFERKAEVVRKLSADGDAAGAATAFERALREFFADRANISAEGLTVEEITRRCAAEGLTGEETARIIAAIHLCAGFRYAPSGGASIDFATPASECAAILKGRAA